jgi:hypothetical protein
MTCFCPFYVKYVTMRSVPFDIIGKQVLRCALLGYDDGLKQALNAGGDPDYCDSDDLTPLMVVACESHCRNATHAPELCI